jgi:hypothetical protein
MFAVSIFIKFALLVEVDRASRQESVFSATLGDAQQRDHAVLSVGKVNKTNVARSYSPIDIFQKIVLRSCMTDLAKRFVDFSELHGLLKISETHSSFGGKFHGIGVDLGGKFGTRKLNVFENKTLLDALVDHWDFEDEKWAGAMGLGDMMKSRYIPNRVAKAFGLSDKNIAYKANMDTIDSYGFSVHDAKELCDVLVAEPSVDAIKKCELDATTSDDPALQTWGWRLGLADAKRSVSKEIKRVVAKDVVDDPAYAEYHMGGGKGVLSPGERTDRIAAYLMGGDIFGQRKLGFAIHDTAYTADQKFLLWQYDPVVTFAGEGNLQKLVEFTQDKRYNLMMLKSVTNRVFKLEGKDADGTPVPTLIDFEEKGLWMAKTMMEQVWGFSITRAEAYCKKKAEKQGLVPFFAVDTQSRILRELQEPVVKRDGKCFEKDGMFCPEGYSPQIKIRKEKMAAVALKAGVWSGPVSHVIGIMIDVAFGLPGTGLALSFPAAWVLWISAPLAVGLHDVLAAPCACAADECTQSSKDGKCVINALAPSSNPYNWLPFPGTKCAPHEVDTPDEVLSDVGHALKVRQTGKCVIQPCASADYNRKEYKEGRLRGVISDDPEMKQDLTLHNCLSVDGSSFGNILQASPNASLQEPDESNEENVPTDNGMALRDRLQLYGELGLQA